MNTGVLKNLFCSLSILLTVFPAGAAQAQFGFGLGLLGNRSDRQQSPSRTNDGGSDRGRGTFQIDPFDFMKNRSSPQTPKERSPREAFEQRFKESSPEAAVREFEALQIAEFSQFLQMSVPTVPPTAAQISQQLAQIAQETGKRPAVLYAVAINKEAHLLLVLPAESPLGQQSQPRLVASLQLTPAILAQTSTPPVIRKILPKVSRERVLDVAKTFRKAVSDPAELDSNHYLDPAQQLYRWIVEPLEPQLKAYRIDTLLFSMDDGLRTIPISALHNGTQFLAETYGSALIPSFGLTNTDRLLALKQQPILAMGISKSTNGSAPLPFVATEISAIVGQLWTGPSRNTLDEASTLENLKQLYLQQRFGVLHLATHAVFNSGQVNNSYIQFWDDKLNLSQIHRLADDLQWSHLPSLQLLVLSACQTALGSKEAELGFAGTAINAGVPAAIASLWSVDDRGSLGLMTGFYNAIQTAPTKADALRQAQLQMLQGKVSLQNGQLSLPNHVPIPLQSLAENPQPRSLQHPYFWSGYTLVGNWN